MLLVLNESDISGRYTSRLQRLQSDVESSLSRLGDEFEGVLTLEELGFVDPSTTNSYPPQHYPNGDVMVAGSIDDTAGGLGNNSDGIIDPNPAHVSNLPPREGEVLATRSSTNGNGSASAESGATRDKNAQASCPAVGGNEGAALQTLDIKIAAMSPPNPFGLFCRLDFSISL